jgi:hypothetical protein
MPEELRLDGADAGHVTRASPSAAPAGSA